MYDIQNFLTREDVAKFLKLGGKEDTSRCIQSCCHLTTTNLSFYQQPKSAFLRLVQPAV